MSEKRKFDGTSNQPTKTTKVGNEKKVVVEKVISSAPIKYTASHYQKLLQAAADSEPPIPLSVITPSIDVNRTYPAQQGVTYQDALKLVDSKTPQYLFPQYAPKNSGNVQLPKRYFRAGGGEEWEDTSLSEWDSSDYRIFVGDLGNEVNDELLVRTFNRYASFQRARVLRDKRSGKSRGFGFVSFSDANDFAKAMKEMNGKYIGNRPCKLKKSNWKERNDEEKEKIYLSGKKV